MENNKGLAIASLVLGIISLLLSCLSILWIPALIGLILSIIGLILAIIARKRADKSGISTGGLVTNIIALIICAVFSIACSAAFFSAVNSNEFSSAMDKLNSFISSETN